MPTIRELIEQLQDIEDKDQPYIGFVRIAEDFEFENENDNQLIQATPAQLAKIATWRSVDREIDYALMAINDIVYGAITDKSEVA